MEMLLGNPFHVAVFIGLNSRTPSEHWHWRVWLGLAWSSRSPQHRTEVIKLPPGDPVCPTGIPLSTAEPTIVEKPMSDFVDVMDFYQH